MNKSNLAALAMIVASQARAAEIANLRINTAAAATAQAGASAVFHISERPLNMPESVSFTGPAPAIMPSAPWIQAPTFQDADAAQMQGAVVPVSGAAAAAGAAEVAANYANMPSIRMIRSGEVRNAPARSAALDYFFEKNKSRSLEQGFAAGKTSDTREHLAPAARFLKAADAIDSSGATRVGGPIAGQSAAPSRQQQIARMPAIGGIASVLGRLYGLAALHRSKASGLSQKGDASGGSSSVSLLSSGTAWAAAGMILGLLGSLLHVPFLFGAVGALLGVPLGALLAGFLPTFILSRIFGDNIGYLMLATLPLGGLAGAAMGAWTVVHFSLPLAAWLISGLSAGISLAVLAKLTN